jgi:hypothetical protein
MMHWELVMSATKANAAVAFTNRQLQIHLAFSLVGIRPSA